MKKILCALLGLILTLPGFAACPSGQVEQTYTSATGTVTQNGTPTPDNPIEPVFYKQGDMILRKVGDIADSYDATTGKITRRVGVKVFDGTGDWERLTTYENTNIYASFTEITDRNFNQRFGLSTHFINTNTTSELNQVGYMFLGASTQKINFAINKNSTLQDWTQFLTEQQNAGTPVTVYYPLETLVEEDWAAEQCTSSSPIKIATTAYNSARFSPVVTELNDTIATIRSVVTNTINQTKAIADLQATKQTRPDETCPAGKKCLLVEDDAGQPHWYEIIESASRLPDGFTELQYIESTGTQYIDTGISTGTNIELKYKFKMTIAPANNGYASVLACRTSANSNSISQGLQSNKFFFGFGNNSEASQSMTVLNKDITVIQNKNQITINNEPYNYQNGYTTTFTDTSMLYLFARNNIGMGAANFFTGRVYYAQIYNNGALVRDFVPAKNSSGVIGMYDLADTNPATAFHTNAGSGTFVAGPAVQ